MATTMIHPFEQRGLGKSPFRYVGMVYQEISYGQAVVGSAGGIQITTQPGGTCDHCGHYIRDMFKVQSSDGNVFKVGCDCIEKVDTVLGKAISRDVKENKRRRDLARIERARVSLALAHSLHSEPHPTQWQADQGKTTWHYCQWLLGYAGVSGKLRAARMIEAAMAQRVEA